MALPIDEGRLVALIAGRFRVSRDGARLELDALQRRHPRLRGDFETLRNLITDARAQDVERADLFRWLTDEVLRRYPEERRAAPSGASSGLWPTVTGPDPHEVEQCAAQRTAEAKRQHEAVLARRRAEAESMGLVELIAAHVHDLSTAMSAADIAQRIDAAAAQALTSRLRELRLSDCRASREAAVVAIRAALPACDGGHGR